MILSAHSSLTMKTMLCAATCFVLPSWVGAQSLGNTAVIAQNGSYTVEPVYVNGPDFPAGGDDLANPVYTSIQASDASQPEA